MDLKPLEEIYEIGGWKIDPNRGIASRDGADVHIEPKVAELLNYLAQRPGDVISRSTLLDAVWPEVTVGEEVVTNTIAKIRRTFQDDRTSPNFIETVPKRGYRLVAPVRLAKEAAEKAQFTASPPEENVAPQSRKSRWGLLTAVAVAIAFIALLFWRTELLPGFPPDDSQPPLIAVAVLPFVNMSGDEEQEYFSDGLTEDLITDLSRISALTVISRTSTFAYKGRSPDVRKMAKELGVSHIIEGSVRKVGTKLRITSQLIEATTGKHLWAERYDRDLVDIFDLQEEVRSKIVAALAIKLSPDEKLWLSKHISNVPEAYDLYLRGLQQESYFTKDNNLNAQNLFLGAIERDPRFAAAYSHLAQTYSLSIENEWTDKREEIGRKALETALRGTQLGPDLPYAYWSLGRIYTRSYAGDLEKAKAAFQKAVSLNPNFADGYMFLAYTYIYTGKAEQSLSLIEKAMRINPHFPFWYLQSLGMAQFFIGNYEASVENLKKAVERNPNVPWLRRHLIASYGRLGMIDEAQWEMSEIESISQPVNIQAFMKATAIQNLSYRKVYEEALRMAGVPEG